MNTTIAITPKVPPVKKEFKPGDLVIHKSGKVGIVVFLSINNMLKVVVPEKIYQPGASHTEMICTWDSESCNPWQGKIVIESKP